MKNQKDCFPYSYGDITPEDELRFSDYVVEILKNPKVQNYATSLALTFFALSSYANPASAIPPEYGEVASQFAENVQQEIPPIGKGDEGNGLINLGPLVNKGLFPLWVALLTNFTMSPITSSR